MEDIRRTSDNKNLKEDEKNSSESSKKFPAWMKWVLIAVGITISSLSAFTLTKHILLPKYHKYKTTKQIAKNNMSNKRKAEMGLIHIIDDLTVNPLGSNGRRFVVVEFAIESINKEVIDEIKIREPQLRDEFIKYLRRKTSDQILDPLFQERSREELMSVINKRLIAGSIDSLYYIKLILQ